LSLPAIVLLAGMLVAAYVLRRTAFGRNVYAIGGESDASRLLGLPVARTRVAVYAISGFCAALSGFLLTVYLSSGSHIEGVGLELDAIAAVVVGGTLLTGGVGSVFGTLLGVLIIGIVVEVITTYEGGFSSGFSRVATGGLLLVFVLIQRIMARPRH
jgi:simple sugar transport system permease protein